MKWLSPLLIICHVVRNKMDYFVPSKIKNNGKRDNTDLENVEVIVELKNSISNEMNGKPG